MSSILLVLVTFLLAFHGITFVKAGLYVVEPFTDTTWHGGQPVTVTWLDDGKAPLLPSIGLVTVGLYTGQEQLVQVLGPVDVSAVHAFTFTPNPAVGPNSGAYYLGFKSTKLVVNDTAQYVAYSPWFRLDRMTGSFGSPLASAISSSPIPSSLLTSRSTTTVLSTITVGTLSTSVPTSRSSTTTSAPSLSTSAPSSSASSSPTSSGFITSRSSATPSSTPSAKPSSSTSSGPSASGSAVPSTNSGNSGTNSGALVMTAGSLPLSLLASLIVYFAI